MNQTYQINLSSDNLRNRVFILQKSELEKRWDPNTYHFERRSIIEALKKSSHKLEPLKFVSTFKKNIVKEIPENLPYLGLENIESNTGSYIATSDKESISSAIEFKKGQVLFPKLRPYLNKVYFAEFDGVCSTEFHVLNSNKVSNEYLANFLRTNLIVNQTKYLMSGNTLPRLQTDDIESLLIPILSTENEEKVNSIMRSVFAQKQTNEAVADKLLSSIDDYLLNELGIKLPEPPENTLKNRMFVTTIKTVTNNRLDPKYFSLKYTNLQLALENSKYKFQKIKSFLSSLSMGISTPEYKSESIDVPFILGKNLKKGFLDLDSLEYISEEINNANKSSILKENDVLFSVRGVYIGKVAVVPKEIEGANIINNIVKFSLNGINPHFVVAYLNSSIGQEFIYREVWGGAQPGFTNEQIKSFPIPVPPLDKQKEIAEHITNIRNQAQALKDKTKDLLKKASEEIEEILLN